MSIKALNWEVENIRLSIFFESVPDQLGDIAKKLWSEVFKEDAERTSTNDLLHQTIAEATRDGYVTTLLVQSKVFQFTNNKIPGSKEAPDNSFWTSKKKEFEDIAVKLVSSELLPVINRLAVGATLHHKVASEDPRAAYNILKELLRDAVKIDDDLTDLVFQVNRTRSSTYVPNVRINRLCSWAKAEYKLASLQLPGTSEVTNLFLLPFD